MHQLKLMFSAIIIMLTSFASADMYQNLPDHLLPIRGGLDVKDLYELNDAMEAMTKKVGACVNAGGRGPKECYCLFPNEADELRNVLSAQLGKHPEWSDKGLFHFNEETKRSLNLFPASIQKSLDMQCNS